MYGVSIGDKFIIKAYVNHVLMPESRYYYGYAYHEQGCLYNPTDGEVYNFTTGMPITMDGDKTYHGYASKSYGYASKSYGYAST